MTPTMKKILKSWLLAAALCFCVTAAAERPVLIHSHNDYCRRAPFWQAYAQGVYSIEADVFLHDGRLLVGHDVEDLSPDMTFESLYVEPIVTLFWAQRRPRMERFGRTSATDGRTQIGDRTDAAGRYGAAGPLSRSLRSGRESRSRAYRRHGTGSRA